MHTHVLIAGATFSGKSHLAKIIAHQKYRARGIGVIVLDPLDAPDWHADVQTTDPATFLACARQSWGCALFIDEAGQVIGHYDREMHWAATTSRHNGHRAHFVCQRPTTIPPVVREQCSLWYLFRLNKKSGFALADESGLDGVAAVHTLPNHHCLVVDMLARTVTHRGPA